LTDLIVIPARFGSTRLPGKPLVEIAGRPMIERVAAIAMAAARRLGDTEVVIATDDERIGNKAADLGLKVAMTSGDISTGSGRALAAVRELGLSPGLVLNFQGDAPFASPEHLVSAMTASRTQKVDVTTPLVQLSWRALDDFRHHKRQSPASGTTCIRRLDGGAVWFSKSIVPYMRNEKALRKTHELSPVLRHVGLYCFTFAALERFEAAPIGHYERLEGLEQLRMFDLGFSVHTVLVAATGIDVSGIDSPADVARAEAEIARHGDPFVDWRRP
jgi:3-deoxy-manno-octulosonate cytidylyltransferase (CMP-KDO synthetase)